MCWSVGKSNFAVFAILQRTMGYRTHFQVKSYDDMSKKLCQKCFEKINEIVIYRKRCAKIQLKLSKRNRINGAISGKNMARRVDTGTTRPSRVNNCKLKPIVCISLIDDESESENSETSTGADKETMTPSRKQSEMSSSDWEA